MKLKIKIISLVATLAQLIVLIPAAQAAVPGEKRMLMVSAYYSPLPGQRYYMRGNYKADLRLNGRGTNGADGTEVYIGMLAAPRTFPFGTRIRIPGLGVGAVHDRGGAIRSYNSYDRIDVWMGHGEEGLARALNWGMRLVEGDVFWKPHQVQQGLSFGWVSSTLPKGTLNRLIGRTVQSAKVFAKPITKQSPATSIKELQTALNTFGYYHGPITGNLGPLTKEAILTFQLDEGVIAHKNVRGAGYFGPKTRATLKKRLETFNVTVVKEQNRLRSNLKALTVGMGKNSRGTKVYQMQQMLWELGYYGGELNGSYDSETIDAVFRFQRANGVIQNDYQKGAGYYGKKTHAALVAAVGQKIDTLAKSPVQMQVWVPAKVELPKFDSFASNLLITDRPDLNFSIKIEERKLEVKGVFHESLSLNDRGKEVVKLQNVLAEHGYFPKGLSTGYFGGKTKDALIQFQLNKGVITKATGLGAGRLGPKTRAVLNAL
jgi:peptidoglycan hydrolase-like protein with peptidoglycan-binding domain/3D (Asp-Asp-Asp) domain-containing protein